jgi:predicted thioesterase
MKDSLQTGIENELSYTVEESMVPQHLGVPVLSTPSMIQLIEGTCLVAVQPHLGDTETTVGTHVCVSHLGAANVGEEVLIKTRLSEIKKRRLTFEVEVHSPRGEISSGTHERAVIDTSKFGK